MPGLHSSSEAGCDIVPAGGGGEALISCGGEEECGARYSLLLCSAGCVPSALALVFLVRGIRRNLVLP